MDRGVTAEYIHLGGTKLNEPVPYRVVLDRMSHEVPYYSVYLKMAALQAKQAADSARANDKRAADQARQQAQMTKGFPV